MVYVNRLCATQPSGQTELFYFSTDVCVGGITDTLGAESAHHSRDDVPLHTAYAYSYTQQLVPAAELHGAGEITSINFLYTDTRPLSGKQNCTIYWGHTTNSYYSSMADYVPPALMQAVYVGSIGCARGWNRIYFDTPFAYNGTDNLVVAIDDNSGMQTNRSYIFDAVRTDTLMTLSFYSTICGAVTKVLKF